MISNKKAVTSQARLRDSLHRTDDLPVRIVGCFMAHGGEHRGGLLSCESATAVRDATADLT